MRDHVLFAVFPYLGGLAFVSGCAVSLALDRRVRPMAAPAMDRGTFRAVWALALATVGIGHILTLAFPGIVLRWDREFVRLVLLEGTRIVAGGLAVAGAIVALMRLLQPPQGSHRSVADVVGATLLVTATISGLAAALLYRWASAWAAVTLAPYLASLARFDPSTELVTRLPVVVKLHVVSSIAIVTILPFTSPARALIARLRS